MLTTLLFAFGCTGQSDGPHYPLDETDSDAVADTDTDPDPVGFTCPPPGADVDATVAQLGERFIAYIATDTGNVAVRVSLPERVRYLDHTGVVVNVATFFTTTAPFYTDLDVTAVGLIHVAYVWPGAEDPSTGACSEGVFDHGGPDSIAVLRDVVRYASGDLSDINGDFLADRSAVTPDANNVGLWAFSHPGIAAVNVMARHAEDLNVAWFVGRENPTQDQHCAVELGHFGEGDERVINPLYDYDRDYEPGLLDLDFSTARWNADFVETDHEDEPGRGYFDLDEDGFDETEDHVLSFRVPTMWGKRYLSRSMTHALRDNGLSAADWPADLATPEEADDAWAFRNSVDQYASLSGSGLRAMLVFGQRQHVQPLPDAPSVHSAVDGFTSAGLWVRVNPDREYARWASDDPNLAFPDLDANEELDWPNAGVQAGYGQLSTGSNGAADGELVGWAAVSEMADRTEMDDWNLNLDAVLIPNQPPPR
jgi:hypothetical protein